VWRDALALDEIAPGGVRTVRVEGREIALCRVDGDVYAVSRRCGHQNAPLEQGCLQGWIITCPLHCAQFDVRTGKNLAWPLDRDPGLDPLPPTHARYDALTKRLQWKTRVYDLDTYPVRVEGGQIQVDL
jgi:nitrite reductase/ring-hydroxylating ferredoxin subunit